jgi:hypothetical protein
MAGEIVREADRPNGPVAAALLAAGIGSAAMGLVTTLAAASSDFATALNWYNPVGPLTGKSIVATVIFFVAWIALHFAFRGRDVDFHRFTRIAFGLLAIGLIGTFPPFFELFAGE